MQIDAARLLGAVTRTVRHFEKDGKPAAAIQLSRTYNTTAEDLWDAVTNQERFPRWFAPVEGDLELGGKFQVVGNASGTITACDPPRSYAATWEFAGAVSWIAASVAPEGSRARLTLEHTMYLDDHWERYGPGAGGVGWELGFMGMDLHIGGAPPVEHAAFEAWGASDEGKGFMRASGEGWRDAHVAAGADPADATAKAERTIAFYCGQPEPGVSQPGSGS